MSFKMLIQTIPLLLLALLVIAILIPACAPNFNSAGRVKEYKTVLTKTQNSALGSPESLNAFTTFLQKIDDKAYVEANTAKVYSADAYLNDTLVTHHGPEEIKAYFLNTADTMTQYQVTVDDTVSSGNDHYVRWTMVFTAPKLNGGKPVESIGMSHIRFNSAGQVIMHQDFWDSGTNIYGQLPVLGGMIESIRRRFEK
ncbi:MAG: nuclear transport factor 2 family protein [Verrucomicrobiota bacterium]